VCCIQSVCVVCCIQSVSAVCCIQSVCVVSYLQSVSYRYVCFQTADCIFRIDRNRYHPKHNEDKTIQDPCLQFHPRIQNLTDIHLFLEETEILELGFQHNFENLREPVIGTEWPSAVWT